MDILHAKESAKKVDDVVASLNLEDIKRGSPKSLRMLYSVASIARNFDSGYGKHIDKYVSILIEEKNEKNFNKICSEFIKLAEEIRTYFKIGWGDKVSKDTISEDINIPSSSFNIESHISEIAEIQNEALRKYLNGGINNLNTSFILAVIFAIIGIFIVGFSYYTNGVNNLGVLAGIVIELFSAIILVLHREQIKQFIKLYEGLISIQKQSIPIYLLFNKGLDIDSQKEIFKCYFESINRN